MTDNHTETTEHFETDEISATRGREQGLGMGARELEAQRDVGDVVAADEDNDDLGEKDAGIVDLDENLAVQGQDDDDDDLDVDEEDAAV